MEENTNNGVLPNDGEEKAEALENGASGEEATVSEGSAGKCEKCGHALDEGRKFCPECGAPQGEAQCDKEETSEPKTCTACGAALVKNQKFCPKCGHKVEGTVIGVPATSKLGGAAAALSKSGGKKTKIIAIAVVCVIALVIAIASIQANVLMGDDKIAYDLVVDVAGKFKNPSSVRLVSGTVGVDKDCLFCGISATNGFGARTTDYYFVMKESETWIMKQEDVSSLYKSTDKLNIKKINKALEKELGKS